MRPVSRMTVAVLILLLPVLACDDDDHHHNFFSPLPDVVGSGIIVSEMRTVDPFDSIDYRIAGEVTIVQAAAQSVRVETDDNIIADVTTTVSGGVLTINANVDYDSAYGVRVFLDMTSVRSLTVTGVADSAASGISSTGSMQATLSGVGRVDLSGAVDDYDALMSGVGTIDAEGLQARLASVTLSGTGDCRITVTERLDALISGFGDIHYAGNPPTVNSTITGTGQVTPI